MKHKLQDVIITGATGATGRELSRNLWDRYAKTGQIKLAIAGRNTDKLNALKQAIGADERLEIICGDVTDGLFAKEIAQRTRLIAAMAGPYTQVGTRVLAACAAAGTDYCDITGESLWMRQMIDQYQTKAEQQGARIMHACGFDSVPSDMGVWYLQKNFMHKYGLPAQSIVTGFQQMGDYGTPLARIKGLPGGTVATLELLRQQLQQDPQAKAALNNPYLLIPDAHKPLGAQSKGKKISLNQQSGRWVSPFIMAKINERIVHRTNFLTDFSYGKDFQYLEVTSHKSGWQGYLSAWASVVGLAGLGVVLLLRPLAKQLLNAPGQGPSEDYMTHAGYAMSLWGQSGAHKMLAHISAKGDPGVRATTNMMGECMMSLLAKTDLPGGFYTPASALGDDLLVRLGQYADMHFSIEVA